jgi:Fe/S biogenesis protein NfuA
MASIQITKPAEKYLDELLQKQDSDTIGVKVFVSEPGSPRAETCIAYCKEDDDISEYEISKDY